MTGKSRKTDCFCTRLKNCVMSCLACRVVAKHNAANLSLKIGCIVAVPKAPRGYRTVACREAKNVSRAQH